LVGEKNNFKIYEFNYINEPGRYRGVMAQDIEKVMPEAIITMKNGYKAVNYQMLGIPFERIE